MKRKGKKNPRSLPAAVNSTWQHTGTFANELTIEQQQSPLIDIRSEEDVYMRITNKSAIRREEYMRQVGEKRKRGENV